MCQEWGVKKRCLGGHWRFLIRDMDDRVILYVLDDVFYPKEDTPKVGLSPKGVLNGPFCKTIFIL